MKKLLLIMFFSFAGLATFASATTKEKVKIAVMLKVEKKHTANKPQWQINFSCDGGNTWGTFCCFSTQGDAQSFWNQNSAMLCGWTQP